jgi:hypothetical protein
MDSRWGEACSLYRAGKLVGINSMKASTAKQNPMPQRLHAYDEGIIIFYCGPSEDEANVMEYGRNILNHMNYPRAEFHYKSDKPHLINHSRPYKNMYTIFTQEHYSGLNRGFGKPMSRFSSFPNINTLSSMNNFGENNFERTVSKNFGRRNSIHVQEYADESNSFLNQAQNIFNPPQARARSFSVSYPSPHIDNFSNGHQSPAFFNHGFVDQTPSLTRSHTPIHLGYNTNQTQYAQSISRSHTPVHFGYNPNQFQFNTVY